MPSKGVQGGYKYTYVIRTSSSTARTARGRLAIHSAPRHEARIFVRVARRASVEHVQQRAVDAVHHVVDTAPHGTRRAQVVAAPYDRVFRVRHREYACGDALRHLCLSNARGRCRARAQERENGILSRVTKLMMHANNTGVFPPFVRTPVKTAALVPLSLSLPWRARTVSLCSVMATDAYRRSTRASTLQIRCVRSVARARS
jgi:hypothetical protein